LARVAAISQQFSQGVSSTSNPLDVAINGNGFFRISKDGTISFSRNGQFHLDPNGYLVNTENQRVTGYGVDVAANIIATSPIDIQLATADIPPLATTSFRFGANLDAGASPPAAATFSLADPTSYNNTTSGSVYDSLGNAHVFSYYFVKTATAGQWNMYGSTALRPRTSTSARAPAIRWS
jgi:flagellar hook protein FlgE